MRNLFDQYRDPENRLTHALACSLDQDPKLLASFLEWAIPSRSAPPKGLSVVEQRIPGEAADDADELEQRGLPDIWIHDDRRWSLLVESKIHAALTRGQLQRHVATARRQGFEDVKVLVLSPFAPRFETSHRTWPELYVWACAQARLSFWAQTLAEYMEIAEVRMTEDATLGYATLTTFHGIPFGADHPYTYREAKRILRLMTSKLRERKDVRDLGADPKGVGRKAITGSRGSSVWDYLPLKIARGKNHTRYPHLTLALHHDHVEVVVTVPNGLDPDLRRRLLEGGEPGFRKLLVSIAKEIAKVVKPVAGAQPLAMIWQRHYPSQKATPRVDAFLRFDPRTASAGGQVKSQPQWVAAAYDALANRRSNLQLGVGARLPYGSEALRRPAALDLVAGTWEACGPLIKRMIDGRTRLSP